jgi:replication-associated recombination protein RarA
VSACELFSFPTTNVQEGFEFPQQLTEKYCPQKIADFLGIDKARAVCQNLVKTPKASVWIFVGASGVGKTTLGLALAREGRFELHHIPSQECNLEKIERTRATCQYVPAQGFRAHQVLIDEADRMTQAAQLSLLSKFDGTNPAPNTIWILTCNETTNLEPRFLSRCHIVEFSSYGISKEVAALLERVWNLETDNAEPKPNFQRLTKESNNNVRAALMALETELMTRGA